jgi:periplasmic divalent cation tolerance protein
VQRFPITSVYTWRGQVVEDPEWLLVIKTRADRFHDVERFVREHHSYEVPQMVMVPITAGHAPYLAWIDEHTA